MSRVALAGFFHETNTFSPIPAGLDAFRRPATLPGLTRGKDMRRVFANLNVPVSGAMRVLAAAGHDLRPVAWASAVPCGAVTAEAFETIAAMVLDGIAAVPGLGGVYLDLHGAMVSAPFPDPEAELLRRLRARIGADVPVVASFDLHANLSAERVGLLDGLAMFRTYPHLDMAETGERAAALLDRCMRGERFHLAHRAVPYLVPLHAQGSRCGTAAALYARAAATRAGIAGAEVALGFPPADVPHSGPSVVVLGEMEAAEREAEVLTAALLDAEPGFAMPLPDAREAVRRALQAPRGPVVIADTQDNPGAGGTGDTVGLLRALMEADAPDAVLALLHDPAAARQAHALGEGAEGDLRLGAHSGAVEEAPVGARFTVERLTDGRVVAQGPMYRGNEWALGATAVLRHRGVRVMVSERRLQAADTAILRHAGIVPEDVAVIALKTTVHFRAEYEAIAAAIIVAAAPGLHLADLRGYPYRHLRPGLRVMPAATPPAPASPR